MAWPIPEYSKGDVNRAGNIISASRLKSSRYSELMWALDVLNNWRGCHGYPINTFQATLRQRLTKIDSEALVAQRLKRQPSIIDKLRRYPNMQLARMQDIGGLRAIVGSVEQVRELENLYARIGGLSHEFKSKKDYIDDPKESGYRGVHIIYRYNNPKKPNYTGLHLEMQFRTRLQHTWATAVETMGTFLNSSLKSSQGPGDWLRFFELAGSSFAILENCPVLEAHKNMSHNEIIKNTLDTADSLDIFNQLNTFSEIAQNLSGIASTYHVVLLDVDKKFVTVESFARDDLLKASQR